MRNISQIKIGFCPQEYWPVVAGVIGQQKFIYEMIDINPEAYELRKRSGNSPADLDAAADFYDRLAAKIQSIARRIPILPYKGFTNYSTWLLCTAVLSNPDLYARLITHLEKFEEVGPLTARLFANGLVRRFFPTIPEANWYHIDWRSTAEIFNEALEEHCSYI